MSLGRQLFLLVALLFVLVFSGTLALSVHNTRDYLSKQLQTHAQDTATSLGLSLSQHAASNDLVLMERMIDAIFKRGYFREISLLSIHGKPLVVRSLDIRVDGVPDWFVDLLPLHTPRAEALVMAGWKQMGHVYVQSHPGLAYQELWNSARETLYWSLVSLALALLLMTLMLRFVLRPLRAVADQAREVSERRFPILEKIPRTRELRQVVQAMNRMVRRVQGMLEEQSARARQLQQEAYVDGLTGLANRRGFDMHQQQLLGADQESGFGTLFILRLSGLDKVNRLQGYAAGDTLLQVVAETLQKGFDGRESCQLARVGSSEFAVSCPGLQVDEARHQCEAILSAISRIRDAGLEGPEVHLGAAMYSSGESPGEVMARVDMALRRAEQSARQAWSFYRDDEQGQRLSTLGASGWRTHLAGVLEQRQLHLLLQAVLAPDSAKELHREVFARIRSDQGELVAAGVFLPMADRLGMGADIDRLVLEKVMQLLQTDQQASFAVNLSAGSLLNVKFADWLYRFLAQHPAQCSRLNLEFSEYAALRHLPVLKVAGPRLRKLGIGLGLDRFGNTAGALACLRGLEVSYIKIDGSYIRGIDENRDNQFLVSAMLDIAHGLDVQVIANFVENSADRQRLISLGVDGMQGFDVAEPISFD